MTAPVDPPIEDEDAAAADEVPSSALAPPRRLQIRSGGRAPTRERLYIVAYDIADQKRWRRVFRTMKGFGRWLQLSVFQCRLSGRRRADLAIRGGAHREQRLARGGLEDAGAAAAAAAWAVVEAELKRE